MPFTREHFARILAATKSNNLNELDEVMLTQAVTSKTKLSKKDLCFKVACHFKLRDTIAKYLELRTYSEDILRIGLFEACKNSDIGTIKLLIEKYHLDPNKNFDISACHADDILDPAINLDLRKDKDWPEMFPLLHATLCGRIEVLRYLAGLRNIINLDKTFRHENTINYTVLQLAFVRPEEAKILLENGANPLIECEDYFPADPSSSEEHQRVDRVLRYSFHTKVLIEIVTKKIDNPVYEIYLDWLSKNKHREHELNAQAAKIAGKHYSPEHSSGSGSNSPASAGSPNGSPPHHQPVLQRTPPESPVASRNGSPPGSPMQLSAGGSSGSAGSSPERVSIQPSANSGGNNKGKVINQLEHDLICSRDIREQQKIYNTGKIKFDCPCDLCADKNLFQHFYLYPEAPPIISYMLNHPQYPADINNVNRHGQTILHLIVNEKDYTDRTLLKLMTVVYKNAKSNPNVNAQDKDGNSPLHLAAARGSDKIVAELLKCKADPCIRNNDGLTPAEYCVRECKNAERKSAVLAVLPKPSNIVSPPANSRGTVPNSAPIIVSRVVPVTQVSTTSYVASNTTLFNGRQNNSGASQPISVAPTTVARSTPQQIGAMHVSPPPSSVQLPKVDKKKDTDKEKHSDEKKSIFSRVKQTLHI